MKTNDKAQETLAGWVTLVVGVLITVFLFWKNHLDPPMEFSEYNLLNTALILWIPLVVILLGLRREPSDFGFTVGDSAKGLPVAFILFALFTPVIYFAAQTEGAQAYYLGWMQNSRVLSGIFYNPQTHTYTPGTMDWGRLFYHEAVMGFYMFGWEWQYRGFLLTGLQKIFPVWGAVLFQAVLFTGMHWGKPGLETASSFPGAILMALLALRFRSFVPCFVLHWLVSAGFDFAVLFFHFRHP